MNQLVIMLLHIFQCWHAVTCNIHIIALLCYSSAFALNIVRTVVAHEHSWTFGASYNCMHKGKECYIIMANLWLCWQFLSGYQQCSPLLERHHMHEIQPAEQKLHETSGNLKKWNENKNQIEISLNVGLMNTTWWLISKEFFTSMIVLLPCSFNNSSST